MTTPELTPSALVSCADGEEEPRPVRVTLLAIIGRACEEHYVTYGEVRGRDRYARIARARHQVWRELRALGWSLSEIGREFGVHHTTVLSAVNKVPKKVRVQE